METACLKIKFVPFLTQSQHGDAKCSVEIVPDVSCVQNFDKIEWKGGKNNIEYTIPITYKIILKKLQHTDKNEVIKTYHSCLDLPLYSSFEDISIGSDDPTRIISDTFILRKLASKVAERDQVEYNESILNKTTNTVLHMLDISHISTYGNNDKDTKSLQVELSLENKVFMDKMTDTSNVITKAKPIKYQIVNFTNVMRTKPIIEHQQEVAKKDCDKLEYIHSNSATGTSNSWSDKETRKDDSIIDYNKVCKEKFYKKGSDICKDIFKRELYDYNSRIPPQERILRYKKMMETEIMPLKIKLNEILHKCKALSLYKFNYASSSSLSLMYKSVSARKNIVDETSVQEKCNRVVYSISFKD